jgi:flagella basal body P-ring formation protein FlgA
MNLRMFILSALVVAAAGALPTMAPALDLELKPETSVSDNALRLGDVANLTGGGTPELLLTPLGSAPTLGQSRWISRDGVVQAMAKRLAGETVTWSGATDCRVNRPCNRVEAETLRPLLETRLAEITGGQGKIQINAIVLEEGLPVPLRPYEIELTLPQAAASSSWGAAEVRVVSQGEIVHARVVRFQWAWIRSVLRAARDIPMGSPVDESAMDAIEMDVLNRRVGVLMPGGLPLDAVAARPLRAGTVLGNSDVKSQAVVARGDRVQVRFASGSVQVVVQGIAMQSGARGDRIEVQNVSSRKRLVARVVDPGSLVYVQ